MYTAIIKGQTGKLIEILFNGIINNSLQCRKTDLQQYLLQLPQITTLSNGDLSYVTAVGEVVISRAHVTVRPRPLDAEARRVAGSWGVVQLSLQIFFVSAVTSSIEVKIQLVSRKLISLFNYFKRQARTSLWCERLASFLYPAHVCSV